MNNFSIVDELDQAIEQLLAAPEGVSGAGPDGIGELLAVASELRDLPRENFKTRLRLELEPSLSRKLVSQVSAPSTIRTRRILPPA